MAKINFFISYTKKDKLWVEWIAWQLDQAGFSTKRQSWDFSAGNFVVKIDNALSNSDRYIIVLSPDYFAAEWCAAEWAAALAKDPDNKSGTLVPVRVEECTPNGLLAPIVYSDLVGLCEEEATSVLFSGINPPGRPEIKPSFQGRKASGKSDSAFPPAFPENNLPSRNINFTGRKDILDGISKTFDGGVYGSPIEVITGPGGIGKSALALEYAYNHAGRYDEIRWINAGEPDSLFAAFTEFAREKELTQKDAAGCGEIISLARNWMANNSGWLFILDNAEKFGDVKEYLPASYGGNMLITSESEAWGNLHKTPLSVLRPDEAVDLLLKSTKAEDRAGAAKLASELGFLPLALEMAAAYISSSGEIGYFDYLELFNKLRVKLFEGETPKPKDYDKTAAVTCRIALSRIKIESARQLLYICSFFSGGGIEKSIFRDCASLLPNPLSEAARNEAEFSSVMSELSRYSLINNEGESFKLHWLVQEALRASSDRKRWLGTCLDLSLKELDKFDKDTWNEFYSFLPHALSIEKYAEDQGMERSFELYQKAFAVYESITGEEHPYAASAYNRIADVNNVLGDYVKALEWYGKALKSNEKVSGKEHTDTAKICCNMAAVYYKQGDHKNALELLIKAIVIYVKKQMISYPDAKKALSDLYTVYVNAGGKKEDFQKWLGEKLKG